MCCLAASLGGCFGGHKCDAPNDSTSCSRVLFIGNSYTFFNDLPDTFASLAESGGHDVEIEMIASGGMSLDEHVESDDLRSEIADGKWKTVVLQEQSHLPATEKNRQTRMYPAARRLIRMIRDSNARPMLFLTWGRSYGRPQAGLANYEEMQAAVDDAYLTLAAEQRVAVAPVGHAWWETLYYDGDEELWQNDGSHPSQKGTYLAACVFYASIFRKSPAGLVYRGDVSREVALKLQKAAARTVLDEPDKWGLENDTSDPTPPPNAH